MIASYTIADVIGRFASSYFRNLKASREIIIFFAYFRVIFIWTSIMIGLEKWPHWLFGSDIFKLSNTFLLGFGNGLLGTFLMILGP